MSKVEKLGFVVDYNRTQVTLGAGKYLITDPCYVLGEEPYRALCHALFAIGRPRPAVVLCLASGREVLVFSTKWGDGCYSVFDLDGNRIGEVGVDSGLLSIWPIEEMPGDGDDQCVTEFKHSVTVEPRDGDLVTLGAHTVVCTCEDHVDEADAYGEYEDEYEDEDEDDED